MDMQVRLTQFSHGGGCGCKIAPGVLEQILSKTAPGIIPKDLLVGIETSDDAAVYRINDNQAIVVDPLNPNVIYIGGTDRNQFQPAGGLIRVDTTGMSDSRFP